MKISFPSKEVYPKFTSVILHGPTVEWQWQGCKGGGGWSGATPRAPPPPPLAGSIRHLSWSPWRPRTEWGGAAASGWWVHGTPRPATRDSRLSPRPATTAAQPAQTITHTGSTQPDIGHITFWKQAGHVLP